MTSKLNDREINRLGYNNNEYAENWDHLHFRGEKKEQKSWNSNPNFYISKIKERKVGDG